MDGLLLVNILFSVVFVLIGSLAFHISALVSGENIYRDLPTLEATLLSTVAGIVIFLLSPISFIIFTSTTTCYANILADILKFEVLFSFFGCAFGLGLIFGCITILKARVNILKWFRYQSGMKFWVSFYEFAWDTFLKSVKQGGEVFVQTDNGLFKGLLESYSTKNEPREIVLSKAKIKRYRTEIDIEGEENARLLITGSEIKGITVPERSFRKHYESMGHISQAFYCQILAIGFFFLSCSAYLTGLQLWSLKSFYDVLSLFFLVLTIVVLCVSVWVAKKDFDNWRSFLVLSPPIAFVPLFFSLLSVLLIICDMEISQALVFIFALLLFSPLYIKILNWIQKPSINFLRHWMEAFSNLKSFLALFRYRGFAVLFLLLVGILLYIFIKQLLPVLISMMAPYFSRLSGWLDIDSFKMLWVLIFIFVLSLLYLTISNWLKKPINDCFYEIKEDFKGDQNQKLLKEAIQKIYLQLSCNEKDQASLSSIKNKILEEYTNDDEKKKIKGLIKDLDKLKGYYSVELKFENDLENDSVLEELKEKFKDENISLPNTHSIKKVGDNKWEIIDEKRKKTYCIIWKEDKELKFFKKSREYLKEEDFNIILEFDIYIDKKIKGKKECENER